MKPLRVRLLPFLSLWIAAPAAPAQDEAPAGPPTEPGVIRRGQGRMPFEETVLENGLRVISLEDHSTPICALQVWYHVGSKDERADRTGFAHMFEHMMFRGTDRVKPEEHFDYIRRTGGDCNAYTTFDQTVYVQEFPSNQLEMVMWLEADRMASLKIDEGGFATEREVVKEERRLGLNRPYGEVLEKVLAFLFPEPPYTWSAIGQISHLEAAQAQELQRFWDTYYVPNNAVLVVVGDVTHERVRELAQRHFGWIPRCPDPPRVSAEPAAQTEARGLVIEPENGPLPIVGLLFRGVPKGHPDDVPLQLLLAAMAGGESSRAYVDLVRRKELAVAAIGGAFSLERAGLAALAALTEPMGYDLDETTAALWEEIDHVLSGGIADEELERVRNGYARESVTELLTVASKASALGEAALLGGDAQLANTLLDRVRAVTPADLLRVAKEYLVRERSNEIRIVPSAMSVLRTALSLGASGGLRTGGVAASDPDERKEVEGGQRASAGGPKAKAARPEGYPDAPPVAPPLARAVHIRGEESALANGLRVVVVENHEVPFVSLSLQMRDGAFTDPAERNGTAAMAAAMITRGTKQRDAEALARELERYAISLSASANEDSAGVFASCLPDQLDRAMRLLGEVTLAPAFDAKEWKTLRRQTIAGLVVSERTPSVLAGRALDEALWGEHPYASPAGGTSRTLRRLEVEDLAAWWKAHARPDRATLYLVGDVTPERAAKLCEEHFGAWQAEGEAPAASLSAPQEAKATAIRLVDQRNAVQSEIRVGQRGIGYDSPHYAAAVLLSQVLGGGFNARLNKVIRVEKGLTYGAGGGFSSRRFGGAFTVHTFTKTESTAETVRAVLAEVQRLRDEPPTEQELADAKSYLAGSFAGSLETPQAVAGRLWTLALHGLPADWWDGYLQRISAVTVEEAAAAAKELIDPEKLVVVVVGDAGEIEEELEAIAPVEKVKAN